LTQTLTRDELVLLTQRAFRLLDAWEVPKNLQPGLLGLAPGARRREVNRYRLGTPLPQDRDCYQRIGLLLKIDNILRKLFPHSEVSANLWVTTPNLRFGNTTPLETMLREGISGIRQVEQSLNAPESLFQ
jgi:hypothetical protein